MEWANKIKPAVPKRILFFVAALFWGFAAYRVLELGFSDVLGNTRLHWPYMVTGFVGFYFFFRYILLKVFRKNTKRIVNAKSDSPCFFSFFDFKGYVTIAFMITAGILLNKTEVIPPLYLGTFYISIGLSLLLAAFIFIHAGIKYEVVKTLYACANMNVAVAGDADTATGGTTESYTKK